jgi:hypothetical protein
MHVWLSERWVTSVSALQARIGMTPISAGSQTISDDYCGGVKTPPLLILADVIDDRLSRHRFAAR